MSNNCNTRNDFFAFDQTRNYVTERLVDREEREQTIKCLKRKYKAGCLPCYSAHYIDKFVPVERDCPCLRDNAISDLIRDYNAHLLGFKNSKQFRLTGGV